MNNINVKTCLAFTHMFKYNIISSKSCCNVTLIYSKTLSLKTNKLIFFKHSPVKPINFVQKNLDSLNFYLFHNMLNKSNVIQLDNISIINITNNYISKLKICINFCVEKKVINIKNIYLEIYKLGCYKNKLNFPIKNVLICSYKQLGEYKSNAKLFSYITVALSNKKDKNFFCSILYQPDFRCNTDITVYMERYVYNCCILICRIWHPN